MTPRLLTPPDWEKFKTIRLSGLRTDPQAFAGDFTEELTRDESGWRRRLGGEDRFFFGVEREDRLLAIAGAKKEKDGSWVVMAVHTLSVARGQGLAQQLIKSIITEAKNRGAFKLKLWVNADQEDAIHVYLKSGFKILELIRNQKMADGKYHDEYSMEKTI